MQNPSLRWLFIGEVHGSAEVPPIVADLACEALANGRHVTVALERPTSEQPSLEAIILSGDLSAARKDLLDQPEWKNGMDGRASEAMLRLLIEIRRLHTRNPHIRVFAFDAPYSGDSRGARDEAMGHALLSLKTSRPDDLILILTGNVHSMLKPKFGYDFAAMYLPPQETISLEVTDKGGESWTSTNGACGALTGGTGDKGANKPFGIYLSPSLAPFGTVNGVLSLDTKLTSSPPAAGVPSALPECRKKYLSEHPPTVR